MRMMTILGSTRRQGNTAKVLAWVVEHLRGKNHEVDHVNILDYNVRGCGECMACKTGTVELCTRMTPTACLIFTGCSIGSRKAIVNGGCPRTPY